MSDEGAEILPIHGNHGIPLGRGGQDQLLPSNDRRHVQVALLHCGLNCPARQPQRALPATSLDRDGSNLLLQEQIRRGCRNVALNTGVRRQSQFECNYRQLGDYCRSDAAPTAR